MAGTLYPRIARPVCRRARARGARVDDRGARARRGDELLGIGKVVACCALGILAVEAPALLSIVLVSIAVAWLACYAIDRRVNARRFAWVAVLTVFAWIAVLWIAVLAGVFVEGKRSVPYGRYPAEHRAA